MHCIAHDCNSNDDDDRRPAEAAYDDDPARPRTGPSRLYLEMTLVENRSGRPVWHVHQELPASAASRQDVERAARALLASLPAP
jgi:hypothetical protein